VGIFGKKKTKALAPAPVGRRESTDTSHGSWLAWPTLAEKKQSWPAVGTYYRQSDVAEAIRKHGRLVMVRYAVETRGEYKGKAVRCWVGDCQVGTIEKGMEDQYRDIIQTLAAQGVKATSRALFDHSPDSPRLWLIGEPEPRGPEAPFLPPLTEALVDVGGDESERLDALFQSKAKTKSLHRVGVLADVADRTWLSLDGVLTGPLHGNQRPYVDQVTRLNFPATCWVAIKRRPDRPLSVSVAVPDER
jgi:hypothetical protein